MKLKDGFVKRKIADKIIILPSGEHLNLNAMITLNESGEFIWDRLTSHTTEGQIVDAILQEYDISPEDAQQYVANFITMLRKNDFLED